LARKTHHRAEVLVGIHRRYREVDALDPGAMAAVALLVLPRGVPGAFHRVDRIEAPLHLVAEAHGIEDEELVLGPEERAVGDAGGPQVGLGALGERARVALVALHGGRL